MSRLPIESQTITIHGASEFSYNPYHTVYFFPGGTGGNGGAGRVSGGGGGEAEGPRTSLRYDITAESFTLTNNLASTAIEQPRSGERTTIPSYWCLYLPFMNCLVDFRSVNLGDLILYDEIDRQNVINHHPIRRRRTGVVIRHIKVVVATRRVYRARMFGSQDPMTVVVHDTKFEQRKAQVLKVQQYRHPLLAQLFGFTCSAGLNAMIYHDDMVTISQIQKMHAQSILASTYVKFQMSQHFGAAKLYWEETTGNSVNDLPGTAWI
ncbi:hypothetical protein DFH08DRAFT_54609 [Mycena albidolilacea]|uniref:Protein kinase domain-containing protein n=1 Tax=Mycena albidolilacea TaxID=1033008 RepID=A0AAD6Z1F6_9AGAR|nr:hypothetical protein DFH08DRAFT_54609 [Mycena albidolilacea]